MSGSVFKHRRCSLCVASVSLVRLTLRNATPPVREIKKALVSDTWPATANKSQCRSMSCVCLACLEYLRREYAAACRRHSARTRQSAVTAVASRSSRRSTRSDAAAHTATLEHRGNARQLGSFVAQPTLAQSGAPVAYARYNGASMHDREALAPSQSRRTCESIVKLAICDRSCVSLRTLLPIVSANGQHATSPTSAPPVINVKVNRISGEILIARCCMRSNQSNERYREREISITRQ